MCYLAALQQFVNFGFKKWAKISGWGMPIVLLPMC